MHITIKNGTRTPGGARGLIMGSNSHTVLMETPLIANGAETFGLKVSLKLQNSNEKSRRLGKISIFLQCRLKWSWRRETIFCELDEVMANRNQICHRGQSSYPYSTWRGVSLSLIFPWFCWPRLKPCTSLLKTEQEPRAVLAAWSWGQILVQFW
jgi:hypothetical protein